MKRNLLCATAAIAAAVLAWGCARDPRLSPGPVKPAELSDASVPVEFRAFEFDAGATYSGALVASNGTVYIAACGRQRPARLAAYDAAADRFVLALALTSDAERGGEDGEALPPDAEPLLLDDTVGAAGARHAHDKIHARLYEGPDGRIYGASDSSVGNEDHNRTRNYGGGHFFAYDPRDGRFTDLGWARRHEGIIAMAMDDRRMMLYGVTWPSGLLLRRHVQWAEDGSLADEKGAWALLGVTTSWIQSVPRYFDVLDDGRVVICDGANGDLLVYWPPDYGGAWVSGPKDLRLDRLHRTCNLTTPYQSEDYRPATLRESHRFRNWWRTGALSPDGGRIYTSGQRGGQLVEIDGALGPFAAVIDHPRAKPWGGPGNSWGGQMLNILGFDSRGRLFYHAEGRLLSYDPSSGQVRDYGRLRPAEKPDYRMSISSGPASFDVRGRMYFSAHLSKPRRAPDDDPEAELDTQADPPEEDEKRPRERRSWSGLGWVDLSRLGDGKLLYTEPRRLWRKADPGAGAD